MILIADSGSTKTDWRLVDETKITQFRTAGLNPYHLSGEEIATIVHDGFKDEAHVNKVKDVFFYGAGCANKEKSNVVAEALRHTFVNTTIHVENDLLAAAHALCGREPGIVAILGTGSNSCLYDGSKITAQVPSLGYLLGDEGSGVHIGKKFLQCFLYNELPADLIKAISEKHPITLDEVLDNIYKKPQANKYISSFSTIIHKHINHPFLIKLVYDCFEEFFSHHVSKYYNPAVETQNFASLQLHAVGSIAYFYSHIFKAVAADKGISVGRILQTPIAGLTLYHVGEKS